MLETSSRIRIIYKTSIRALAFSRYDIKFYPTNYFILFFYAQSDIHKNQLRNNSIKFQNKSNRSFKQEFRTRYLFLTPGNLDICQRTI